MSGASEESPSTGCITPDSSSTTNSPPSLSSSSSVRSARVNYDEHPGPRNRTASIDLWSADITDLGMKLSHFDEYNPPSVQTETASLPTKHAQFMYYFTKCQDLTQLLHESREIIRLLGSRVNDDSQLVSRFLNEIWAQDESNEDVSRSLARAEDRLELEHQSREELSQLVRQKEEDLATLDAELARCEAQILDAAEADALIQQLVQALRAQKRELHVAVKAAERMGGWHDEVLDHIKQAMEVGMATGNKAIESWRAFLSELCMDCRLNADVGDVDEVLKKVEEWEAGRRSPNLEVERAELP